MTEQDWMKATDPQPMLEWLRHGPKAQTRKLLLFAVACCRHVGHCLTEERSRQAIELAERFAEGTTSTAEFRAAWQDVGDVIPLPFECERAGLQVTSWYALRAVTGLASFNPHSTAWDNVLFTAWAAGAAAATEGLGWDDAAWDQALRAAWTAVGHELPDSDEWDEVRSSDAVWEMGWESFTGFAGWTAERKRQAALLRDIFGPLRFRSVSLSPSLLQWNDSTVVQLARAIYEERTFDRMPIVADALEEAGCMNQDILAHCRSSGNHVRGCWIVDLLLDKS